MANLNIAIQIAAQDQASGPIGVIRGALGGLGNATDVAQRGFAGLQTVVTGALVGGATLAAGAILGIGAAAFSVASDFQGATNAIIIGTGASGEALSGMEQIAKNLRGTSAGLGVEFGTLGAVIAEVNTRTGATGETLEDFSSDVLNLSRLTGGDAVRNTQLITRVMGDWGVAMEDGGELMDQLFGAGQAFGIGVDDLSAKVVQFGAPLRQMGFTLEESIALFGKWEKEGVNAELAIGSLRIAAGKFAREGVDLRDGLRDTMEAIKGATSESEGLAIAMDVFGARAGPDMAAAIREGRFELDSAIEALEGTSGGLADASARALTLGDRWEIFKNKATTALIPLGNILMNLAERVMPPIESALDAVTGLLSSFFDEIENGEGVLAAIMGLLRNLGVSLEIRTQVHQLATAISNFFQELTNGEGAMAALMGFLREMNVAEDVRVKIHQLVTTVGGFIARAREVLTPIIEAVIQFVSWKDVLILIGGVVASVVIPALLGLIGAVASVAAPVVAVVVAAIGVIALLRNAWEQNWGGIRDIVAGVIGVIGRVVNLVQEFFSNIEAGMSPVNALSDLIGKAFGPEAASKFIDIAIAVTDFKDAAIEAISPVVSLAQEFFSNIEAGMSPVNALSNLIGKAFGPEAAGKFIDIVIAVTNFKDAAIEAVAQIHDWFMANWPLIQAIVLTAWEVIQGIIAAAISVIQPAISLFVENVRSSLVQFQPLLGMLGDLWTALQPVITTVLAILGATLLALLGVAVGVISGIAAAVTPLITTFVNVVGGIIHALTGLFTFLQGFFNLVVGLFTGNGEMVRAAWDQMVQGITQLTEGLVFAIASLVVGLVSTVIEFIGGLVTGVITFFKNLYDELVGSSIIPDMVEGIIQWIDNLVTDFINLIIGLKDDAITLFLTLMEDIISTLEEKISTIVSIGRDIVEGLKQGIQDNASQVIDAIADMASAAWDKVKAFFGINSPARLMVSAGESIAQGLAIGLLENVSLVDAAISSLFGAADPFMGGGFSVGVQGPAFGGAPIAPATLPSPGNSVVNNYYLQANYQHQDERDLRDDIRLLQMLGGT